MQGVGGDLAMQRYYPSHLTPTLEHHKLPFTPHQNVHKEYGIAKQTVSGIRKNKNKLKTFALQCDVEKTLPSDTNLEKAVHKWYVQQRSSRVVVRGVELQAAAERLAKHMNIEFKARDGWLYRFRNQHGIVNKRIDYHHTLLKGGETGPTKENIREWLDGEDGDPGY
uniref:HTH CENPB-type domain-containing protein n=1 Tax=Timema genevievae TaxID=629358 RepID=A0A7R9JQG1_TIMGE|nr:unnamed protein product [Timema genevievae]